MGLCSRSPPLDLSAYAFKCSPGRGQRPVYSTSTGPAGSFWTSGSSLSVAAGTIATDNFSIQSPVTGAAFVKERGRYCSGSGFRGQCRTVQRHWVSMQRGNSERQIHWHECMSTVSEHLLQILLPLRYRLTPLSDGVSSWKIVVETDSVCPSCDPGEAEVSSILTCFPPSLCHSHH